MPSTSPSGRSPRLAARTQPVSSALISLPPGLDRCVFGKCLERDNRKSVLHSGQSLQPLGNEPTDVDSLRQITLHQEIVLIGSRIDFRHLLEIENRLIRNGVGLAQIALDHDED